VVLPDVPKVFTLKRDPKDEPYLNHALATAAEYLVSRDLDLLDLMLDESFRQRYPNLTILAPPAFLQVIARQGQPESATEAGPEQGQEPDSAP
jgi:predicted nucleic acid-binding protein